MVIPSFKVFPSGFLNLIVRSVVQAMSFFSSPTDTDVAWLTKFSFNVSERKISHYVNSRSRYLNNSQIQKSHYLNNNKIIKMLSKIIIEFSINLNNNSQIQYQGLNNNQFKIYISNNNNNYPGR